MRITTCFEAPILRFRVPRRILVVSAIFDTMQSTGEIVTCAGLATCLAPWRPAQAVNSDNYAARPATWRPARAMRPYSVSPRLLPIGGGMLPPTICSGFSRERAGARYLALRRLSITCSFAEGASALSGRMYVSRYSVSSFCQTSDTVGEPLAFGSGK